MYWSWSKSCALHPHPISHIVTHSYSSSCRWWCWKFIFFILCTIICMHHLISLIQTYHAQPSGPASTKVTCTKHLLCSSLLVTTFFDSFWSAHATNYYIFVFGDGFMGQFGRRNLLEKFYVMMHVL